MKLSEYKNEEALDLLCDILEPTAEIFSDPAVAQAHKRGASKIELVRIAVKNHEKEVIDILARLDGVPRDEYSGNIVSITLKLLEVLNDKELTDFFTLQAQNEEQISSTAPTETTEEKGK